ncbi:MAG: LacI family DNA-binding transcriptional regulator [Anaerolineaceae bacterium]|nr:LacI family DNA-binding transcriptional regulator [Anaerolineaceae bacterium]
MSKVTIKDVAKVANVSFTTVSRALSGNPEISRETRDRILKICDEMGYTTNYIARSMIKKKTELIGLILPSIDNPFMSELAYHVEVTARRFGYNMILCNSHPDLAQELKAMQLMVGHQVDGVLIIPRKPGSFENLLRYTSLVPSVFLSENLRDRNGSYISVDNFHGTKMGTEYLYRLGHRNILYFGCREGSTTHQLRADGYTEACRQLGIPSRIIYFDSESSSIELGYARAKEILSKDRDFSAVFASTDSNAIGLMQAAKESGIRIPEDISLLGFDNIRIASLPQIDLTTIAQPKEEMAVRAVKMLIRKIEGGSTSPAFEIIEPELVERGSCRVLSRTG